MKKVYVCDVCGYEYDGDVPFEQLPDDWTCPLCGIGLFFVEPYVQATYAELYAKLRDRALSEGFATLEELPGALPQA